VLLVFFLLHRDVPEVDRLVVTPEAKVLPSFVKATEKTECLWPFRVTVFLPLAISHKLMVPSPLAAASILPSGLNAKLLIEFVKPFLRVFVFLPVVMSQM